MVQIGTGRTRARAQLCGGVLRISWLRGAVINEADARAAVAAAGLLSAARTHPLLVELSGLAWMSCKAQNVFAAPSPVTRVALLGSSPVDRVIANFYIGRHLPHCPTRYFTSEDDAMAWLIAPTPPASETLRS
jgi:hypothetical protein